MLVKLDKFRAYLGFVRFQTSSSGENSAFKCNTAFVLNGAMLAASVIICAVTVLFKPFFCLQGYLFRCRNKSDMFSDEQISMVFGNIEDIYIFQKRFAAELDSAVNRSAVSSTELGKIFLKYVSWFYTSTTSRTMHIVMVCVRRT